MSKTDISVIIPTYCPEDYLWTCLDSLHEQTFAYERFEVILILNGKNTPYDRLITEYLEQHPLLQATLLTTQTSGVSNARNMGLDAAKGEFIAFVDDDDFVSPTYLEELYETAVECGGISICYPYAFEDGKEYIQLPYEMTDTYENLSSRGTQTYAASRKFFGGPCMKLFPRRIICDRRFDTRFSNGEDSLFMFLISDSFHWIRYTSKEAMYYRRFRKNSATTQKFSRLYPCQNMLRLMEAYSSIYLKNPFKYSLPFFLTRLMASVRGMISQYMEMCRRKK